MLSCAPARARARLLPRPSCLPACSNTACLPPQGGGGRAHGPAGGGGVRGRQAADADRAGGARHHGGRGDSHPVQPRPLGWVPHATGRMRARTASPGGSCTHACAARTHATARPRASKMATLWAPPPTLLHAKQPRAGGARFTLDTLAAAGQGAALAAPLVALRAWSWTPHATDHVLPQLEDMRLAQVRCVRVCARGRALAAPLCTYTHAQGRHAACTPTRTATPARPPTLALARPRSSRCLPRGCPSLSRGTWA